MLPEGVVNAYVGHSSAVAASNYVIELTTDVYRKAIEADAANSRQSEDVQNHVQNPADSSGREPEAVDITCRRTCTKHGKRCYTRFKDRPGETRTPDQGIMSPLL